MISDTSNGVSWPDHIFYSIPKAFPILWHFQLRWHCWQTPAPTQQPKPGMCHVSEGKAFHLRSFLATLTSWFPLREKGQGRQQSTKTTYNIYYGRSFLYLVHPRRWWTCVDFGQSINLHNQETWCLGMLPETRKERAVQHSSTVLLSTALIPTSLEHTVSSVTGKHAK